MTMSRRSRNSSGTVTDPVHLAVTSHADPGDIAAQSNLIGASEPVSVRPIPADQNGDYSRVSQEQE
jgi:hypothetical protein